MSSNEVIVKGGLGNQIFCLFFAYKILLSNKKVTLNLANYSLFKRKDREFVLDNLFPLVTNLFEISKSNKSFLLFLSSKFIEKFFVKPKLDSLPGDKSFSLQYLPDFYLHSGYFQKITNSDLDQNTLDFFKKQIAPFLRENKSNFLAIHIRRGDYLNKKHKFHGTISEKYLAEESKKQLSIGNFEGIRIFSDTPELIDLNIFKSLHKNLLIDKGGDPVEVFKRMSNHKGLVASNSSFSLWAGILGNIKYFSIPYFWMKNVRSSLIGLHNIPRYKCHIE